MFQFAGHGTQVDDVDGDEKEDGLDEAFCPVDFPTGRFLIDDDVRAVFSKVRPGVNVTSFIDCCHSGSITRALVPGGGPPPTCRLAASRGSSRIRRTSPRSTGSSGRTRRMPNCRRSGGRRVARHGRSGAGSGTGSAAAMLDVCFSACLPTEVAYESCRRRAVHRACGALLAEGGAVTHAAFSNA